MYEGRWRRDDPARAAAYEAENRVLCSRGARSLCWLSIGLTPAFLLVDAATSPTSQDLLLLGLRLLGLAVAIGFLGVAHSSLGKRWPRWLVLLFDVWGAALTFAMMSETGGHSSTYFAGIGLVMLGTAMLVPWSAAWMTTTCVLLIAMYGVYGGFFEPIGDGRTFLNNSASYVATAILAIAACAGRAQLRRREFESRYRLERSEETLWEQLRISAALERAGRDLAASLEAPEILDDLCRLTTELLACDASHTILLDESEGTWRGVSQCGDAESEWRELREARARHADVAAFVTRLFEAGVVQLRLPAPELPAMDVAARTGIRRTMLVALREGQRTVGIQTAARRASDRPFTDAEERLFLGLGQLASLALANARLHQALVEQRNSERKARADAELASRAKDEFLATLSHELRTPLNVIVGYTEIMKDHELPEEERADVLSALDSAGRQLVDMITDTLEISRLQAGHLSVQLEPVALPSFWQDLRAGCERLPRGPEVELRWQPNAPEVAVVTDPRLLRIIVRNLVSNALKFTERGFVEVSLELLGDAIAIRVLDTGIGIDRKDQMQIFEMFRQLDSSDTRRHGGVGLGLYIVRRLASELGVHVDVQSERGKGSIFTVRLPCPVSDLRAA